MNVGLESKFGSQTPNYMIRNMIIDHVLAPELDNMNNKRLAPRAENLSPVFLLIPEPCEIGVLLHTFDKKSRLRHEKMLDFRRENWRQTCRGVDLDSISEARLFLSSFFNLALSSSLALNTSGSYYPIILLYYYPIYLTVPLSNSPPRACF